MKTRSSLSSLIFVIILVVGGGIATMTFSPTAPVVSICQSKPRHPCGSFSGDSRGVQPFERWMNGQEGTFRNGEIREP